MGKCASNSKLGAINGGGRLRLTSTFAIDTYSIQIFGPNWRCPSPVVLHIGNADQPSTSTTVCPMWKLSNELFGKVFQYRSGASSLTVHKSETAEAGLLYLGIKRGWGTLSDEAMQSPALAILKQVDQLLFRRLSNMERLALVYKNYKLLKVRTLLLAKLYI